ncbi:MAG: hypothetical protein AAF754_13725 [Pseudomonadota bacterium]
MFRTQTLTMAILTSVMAHGAHAQTTAQSVEIFRTADANGDTALSYDEFVVFIDLSAAANIGNAGRVKAMGLYKRGFKRVDANGDQRVTPDELQAMAGS